MTRSLRPPADDTRGAATLPAGDPLPAARPDLSATLARRVLALIRERELGPGDRLPATRALAEQFAVATPTMREALRRLQATGVVDIRHGSGIYVRRAEEPLMLSNPAYGALESHTALQLLDARLLIEPHLAGLAARQASAADLAELGRIVALGEAALTRRDDAYYRINARFHAVIARAAGNVVLAQVVESLVELYSSELHAVDPTGALEEARRRDHEGHLAIVAALRGREAARARAAMVEHITVARVRVAARLAEDASAAVEAGASSFELRASSLG